MKSSLGLSIALPVAAAVLSACSGGSSGGESGDAGGSGSGAPSLSVSWVHTLPCTQFTASDVTVTLTAVDDVDAEGQLTYSGNVNSCGPLNQKINTVECPQIMPYPGSTATVTDTDGNFTTVLFAVDVCTDDMAG